MNDSHKPASADAAMLAAFDHDSHFNVDINRAKSYVFIFRDPGNDAQVDSYILSLTHRLSAAGYLLKCEDKPTVSQKENGFVHIEFPESVLSGGGDFGEKISDMMKLIRLQKKVLEQQQAAAQTTGSLDTPVALTPSNDGPKLTGSVQLTQYALLAAKL